MLEKKIYEFNIAIEKYHNNIFYNKLGYVISIVVIFLQLVALIQLGKQMESQVSVDKILYLVLFIFSYVLTDFINGLIHMYMDNNTNYTGLAGPLIAAFHMHHKQPRYRDRHAVLVYIYESGAKVWLPFFLGMTIILQYGVNLPLGIHFCLVSIGILSSVAEVSHYWCHNSRKDNKIISFLQKYRILLPKKHHMQHHLKDNKNYAFLNGLTDPLINFIAAKLFNGYKEHADKHVLAYDGHNSGNR